MVNIYSNVALKPEIKDKLINFLEINKCTSFSDAIGGLLLDNEMLKLENRRLKRRMIAYNKAGK